MDYKIALIRGDGIGPEVVGEAVKVLNKIGEKFGHTFTYTDVLLGGCAIDACGKPFPDDTEEKCKACDAVLLGAVGGPKWDSCPADIRPEKGLLAIRKALGLYANLRPATLRPALADASPLKKETVDKGIDLMMVRELTGGIYFGKRDRYETEDRGTECTDLMAYSEKEIERIGRRAFELARLRRKKVTSVDKANVLETSRLWRSIMHKLAEEYSDVEYSDASCIDLPMAVLVNVDSYSAAEFFAAALQEYGAAKVVGVQTVGKGYFQNTFRLSDGSAMAISTGRYCTPNGVSLAGVGITPDEIVELSDEDSVKLYYGQLAHEDDAQLTAAVALLSGD